MLSKPIHYFLLAIVLLYSQFSFATTTTVTLNPIMDNFLHGVGHQDENEGGKSYLRIQDYDRYSHVLLRFDSSAIRGMAEGKYVVSANLELYIETNYNNWQTGTTVDAHKLLSDWTEYGSTWNCSNDTNLNNTSPDCPTQWGGGLYEPSPSFSLFHQNNDLGWKTFTVSQDVSGIVAGVDDFGWLIRKTNPNLHGSVDYTSIQGNSTRRPRLVIIFDDQPPVSSFRLNEVAPYILLADGSNKSVVLTGSNFTGNMQVFLDEATIPFTFINSTQVTINLNFNTSEMHYLEIRSSDGTITSFWEKGLFAVNPGEIVTNVSTRDIAPGAIISIYTASPGFEEDAKIYFDPTNPLTIPTAPTSTMVSAIDPVYISENEMEITIPPGTEGTNAIYSDNSAINDIYNDSAIVVSAAAQPNGSISTCSVYSVNFISQYGSWRKVDLAFKGCCSSSCSPQHFFAVQYYIDGQNQSAGCNDLAARTSTADWTFLPSGSHTIGARVVEFTWFKEDRKRIRECVAYSAIKNTPSFKPTVGSLDDDHDSISTFVENTLKSSYSPFFRLNLYENNPPDGVPISLPVRIGPINLKQAAPRTDILMNYNALWTQDRGCPAGEGDHPYDTEPMGYLVQGGVRPDNANGWTVKRTVTIAHDATPAENVDMTNTYQSQIFAAYNKHALFLRPCDYFCNYCDSNGVIPNLSSHNVGNGPAYPHPTCTHPEHLTTGNYLVPQKWTNVRKKFGSKYSSPFPAE